MKFTILMYTDPDHTDRMSRDEIERAKEIAGQILDDHVVAVEIRAIHDAVDEN